MHETENQLKKFNQYLAHLALDNPCLLSLIIQRVCIRLLFDELIFDQFSVLYFRRVAFGELFSTSFPNNGLY